MADRKTLAEDKQTESAGTKTPYSRKKRRLIIEMVLMALGVAVFALLLRHHTPKIIQILESGSISDVESYIRGEGAKGGVLLVLLQVIETVSIVLPALPVYICAGVLFGKIKGFLMCYLTNLVMNLIIFEAAGILHIHTDEFAKVHQNPKLERLMHVTGKPSLLVLLMCLLPVVPNGMIPYVSSQTDMTLPQFMKGLAVGSLPAILFYVCCGDLLLGGWHRLVIPALVLLVIALIIAFILRKKLTAVLGKYFGMREN